VSKIDKLQEPVFRLTEDGHQTEERGGSSPVEAMGSKVSPASDPSET
jgi:hypothetical protein